MPQDFYDVLADGTYSARTMPVGGQFVARAE